MYGIIIKQKMAERRQKREHLFHLKATSVNRRGYEPPIRVFQDPSISFLPYPNTHHALSYFFTF